MTSAQLLKDHSNMTIGLQIALGSLVLGICSAIHIGILVSTVELLRHTGRHFAMSHGASRWAFFTTIAFMAVVLAHTIQVWIWAASFVVLSVVPTPMDAIYFSLVTYTTLGYGDVISHENTRIFAAMAAVTGLLNFGLSTAFLVGLLANLLPKDMR